MMSIGVFAFLMKVMAETLGVDGRVVIDAGAEERDHPLVDGVLAVVALPVGEAGAGDGGAEALRLGDGEHGHEAAVAPAGEAFAVLVDGVLGFDGVDAREDVAEVAVAEVLEVGGGELLALAEAAARVRLRARSSPDPTTWSWAAWDRRCGWAAVDGRR